MMGARWRRAAVAVLALAVIVADVAAFAAETTFGEWRAALREEAIRRGVSASTFERAFTGVQPIARVIELDRRQPELTQTFWRYLERRVSDQRIEQGREFLAKHRRLLAAVQRRYGVQPRFLVAFLGLESNYGTHTGSFPLIGALATLAYDERRSRFFREQLLAALQLMEKGDLAPGANSSWAGAMGLPQFMPTTYFAYAVDFDGDGRRDLWNSLPDILASAANYLAAAGWQGNRTWGREVRLPAGFDYRLAGLKVSKPLSAWQRLGVRRVDGRALPRVAINGSVLLPAGARGGPALMVYDNFRTIMAWNRSILYAVAVGHLSDRVVGKGPFVAARPSKETPLSRNDVIEMQTLLRRLGIDAGEADGVVGSRTREAIRIFQGRSGLPPDGYPTAVLLDKLRLAARQ